MQKTLKRVLFSAIFLSGFLVWGNAEAADHYVSPTGTATWASSTNISTPCSISTASSNVAAGDTVNLRGGTYLLSTQNGSHINLINKNGSAENPITFQNCNNEKVEFDGTYGTRMWGLIIDNSSYIKISGIIFSDYSDYLIRDFSNHIEIANCTFQNKTSPYRGGSFQINEGCYGGSSFTCPVNNLWIHDNTFYKLVAGGGCTTGISEGGDALRIGFYSITCNNGTNCAEGKNRNITVENNYMAYAGHAVMDSYSINSVFRNNVAHNEPWYPADNGTCSVNFQPVYTNPNYNGLYSHRLWQFTDTYSRDYSYNLIEGNRLGHSGVNPNNDGATALSLASPGNIVRYNALYDAMNNSFKYKYGANYGWQASGGINNRVYNNTMYRNGYGYPYFQTCTTAQNATCPKPFWNFRYYAANDEPGNVAINNIVYGGYGTVVKGNADIQPNTSGSIASNNFCTKADSACSAYGDPKFINPDLTQTDSKTLPDLNLQSDSSAIDGGIFLAKASGSGNNATILFVNDAHYFQSGSNANTNPIGADFSNVQGDWIALGSSDNVAQIIDIDYTTNKITLDSPKTWSDAVQIWLYKKSDGKQVLYGAKSDYGAYEYSGASVPSDTTAPSAPAGLAVN